MTTTLVLRLSESELAKIDSAARKRSLSRSAYVRQVLRTSAKTDEAEKGAGWVERLQELQAKARKLTIKGHPEDEIREMDRSRGR